MSTSSGTVQSKQLYAGGVEQEGTRKVPPHLLGHFAVRCPHDPLSPRMRRTTVSHRIIVGSSMFSPILGFIQPRTLWLGSTTAQATACSTVAFLDDKVRFTGSESTATAEEIHFWDVMVITGTGNLLLYLFLPLLFFCCSSVSSFMAFIGYYKVPFLYILLIYFILS